MTDENTGTTVVYWRKMCGFCARLLGELEQAGVDVELRDIWEDPEAAAFVRSVNDVDMVDQFWHLIQQLPVGQPDLADIV